MDTAPLKNFATSARTDLIKQVGARLDAVLAPGSNARAEQPAAVGALQAAVEREGRNAVTERVAYTWFNRIIALRFMDANGYTAVGVVSPEAGKTTGQPQVLSDAKGGDFDGDVVNGKTQAAVTALLNGTRPSRDGQAGQGEAYGLLLEAYCRYWNKAMPFMFEREGDYTELLMPAALLSSDSVRDRAVKTLTKEVCAEVEVIGWLYQFYISERKDEVFAGFKKNKKAGVAEIPAATQLFTPHWIVRYLVENSLGRVWMLNRPTSRLAEKMDYYVSSDDAETDFLQISSPEDLRIVDPAVGSGHMLTHAFDLLYAIYEEDGYAPTDIPSLILQNNLYGIEIDPRAGALAAFALVMKARAKKRTLFLNKTQPNICVLTPIRFEVAELDYLWSRTNEGGTSREEVDMFWTAFDHADTFGSLIQPIEALILPMKRLLDAHAPADGDIVAAAIHARALRVIAQAEYLSQRYSAVVANPPYMGGKNMDSLLGEFAKVEFGRSRSDLFAMFIERCLALGRPRSRIGMITMQSWMFGSSLAQLREALLGEAAIRSMAHLGTGAFDTISGAVVSTTAFILEKSREAQDRAGVFVDLTRLGSESAKSAQLLRALSGGSQKFVVPMSTFADIPGSPIAYWAAPEAVAAFRAYPPLSTEADLKAGISTGDNTAFERQWYEVDRSRMSYTGSEDSIGKTRWTPCSSGGRFRRWYGNNEVVMDWEQDGAHVRAHSGSAVRNASFMGRAGLTYSKIGGALFAARTVPAGFVFDDTGRMIFPRDSRDTFLLAALLNSSTSQYFLDLMSPGLTFTSAEIGNIPLPPMPKAEISALAVRATDIAKADWDASELSWDFRTSPLATLANRDSSLLSSVLASYARDAAIRVEEAGALEQQISRYVANAYGLDRVVDTEIPLDRITLSANSSFRNGGGDVDPESQLIADACRDLVSYAVGCLFGRYSLDEPGLILADSGDTLQDYLRKVANPSLLPDGDNVIPIVDGDWFEDDIVGRFRQFLRVAFGEKHFEQNLRFVTESLGVKELRDHFVKSFYRDHVQRYKKRPIYWLFSSPKGSFNALIYMHRYTPSTASTVLNEYLREYIRKLEVNLEQQDFRVANGAEARETAAALKEADRLRKVLVELREYERDLYTLASRQIALNLDDGVLVNYQKFGTVLKNIGLKKAGDDE